jgi:hypothetical protein
MTLHSTTHHYMSAQHTPSHFMISHDMPHASLYMACLVVMKASSDTNASDGMISRAPMWACKCCMPLPNMQNTTSMVNRLAIIRSDLAIIASLAGDRADIHASRTLRSLHDGSDINRHLIDPLALLALLALFDLLAFVGLLHNAFNGRPRDL